MLIVRVYIIYIFSKNSFILHFLGEKSRLRKQIPTFVLKMSLIAGKTTSLKYLQQMLKMLIQLTGDQVIFRSLDASVYLTFPLISHIISVIMMLPLFCLVFYK